jgi:hypothetical protein
MANLTSNSFLQSLIQTELVPTKKNKKQKLFSNKTRDLTETDIDLMNGTSLNSKTPSILHIKTVHHQAASLIASGMRMVDVSAATGLCQSRLSILKNDPSFKDLLEHYSGEVREEETEVRKSLTQIKERILSLSSEALETLIQRIEEHPDEISTRDLGEIAKLALDRGGFAPVTKISKEIGLSPAILDTIKSQARLLEGDCIDITPKDIGQNDE